jgi:hypothetical protein
MDIHSTSRRPLVLSLGRNVLASITFWIIGVAFIQFGE